jgi:hypothetical protein
MRAIWVTADTPETNRERERDTHSSRVWVTVDTQETNTHTQGAIWETDETAPTKSYASTHTQTHTHTHRSRARYG